MTVRVSTIVASSSGPQKSSASRPAHVLLPKQVQRAEVKAPHALSVQTVTVQEVMQPAPQEQQQLVARADAPLDARAAAAAAAAAAPHTLTSSLLPKLALLGSAFLWGSYAPAVRLLYSSPHPPDPAVVMAVRGILQAGALVAVTLALQQRQQPAADAQDEQQQEKPLIADEAGSDGKLGSSGDGSGSSGQQRVLPGGAADLFRQWLTLESPPLWMAALELGLWNFCATALQTVSLQLISATRASFLVQATLLITPLLSAASGYRPSRNVWAGCALALAGCLLITADEAGGDVATGWTAAGLSLGGDTAILAAALFYSLAVVRIAGYARSLPSFQLATSKGLVLGGLGVVSLLAAAGSAVAHGQSPASLWEGYDDPLSWAALLWAGLGPGALASYLHIVGQKEVPPAQAQVIFSSKPLWSASLAWVLLGGEDLGPMTWLGGATLVVAGLIASSGEQQQPKAAAGGPKEQ